MADGDAVGRRLGRIKHVVLVLSGKGGVGKSTVAVQLALDLATTHGKRVGLLDADLCGPSIPRMLGLSNTNVHQSDDGWIPVFADESQRLSTISIGFLLKSNKDAVIWRGPKKTAMIKQFVTDVSWGELDYLVIDTPPGTSDEHMTIVECLRDYNPDGAVLVTTPQGVALSDVRREANFCEKAALPILGLVENMSGFVCPNCSECTHVFSTGGGERLAEEVKCPFLGRIPLDPALGRSLESGASFAAANQGSPALASVQGVVANLVSALESAEQGPATDQP